MKAKYLKQSHSLQEQSEMKEPELPTYNSSVPNNYLNNYSKYIASLKTYPVSGEVKEWEDGDILVQDVDYKIVDISISEHYEEIAAVPLENKETSLPSNNVIIREDSPFGNTCSNHKKDISGIFDMKQLAEMIGDLHYESLAQLFKHLSQKLKQDSRKDWSSKKVQLSIRLKAASINTKQASNEITQAWQISKPFMTK